MSNGNGTRGKILAAVLAALVTAYASYVFGKSTMKSQVIRDQRAAACVQFVDNRALMDRLKPAESDETNKAEYLKARSLYNAARFRLAIFGGKEVVEALAQYSSPNTPDHRKATTRLFQAMRHDLLSDDDAVDDTIINAVLWEESP